MRNEDGNKTTETRGEERSGMMDAAASQFEALAAKVEDMGTCIVEAARNEIEIARTSPNWIDVSELRHTLAKLTELRDRMIGECEA